MLLVSHRPGAEGASVQFIDGVNVFEPFPILRSGIKKNLNAYPQAKQTLILQLLCHMSVQFGFQHKDAIATQRVRINNLDPVAHRAVEQDQGPELYGCLKWCPEYKSASFQC